MNRLNYALVFACAAIVATTACGSDNDDSAASGGAEAFACAFEEAAALCDGGGCPLSAPGRVTCNGYVAVALSSNGDGAPMLALDPSIPGDLLLVDTAARALEPLGPSASTIAATVDEAGTAHIFEAGAQSAAQWVHRSYPGGQRETIADEEVGYFDSRAARSKAGSLAALAVLGTNDAEDLWLATRKDGGQWEAHALGLTHPANVTLEMAEDGTPLTGYFITENGAWAAKVQAGDEPPFLLPFNIGTGLVGGLAIVPGLNGWKAAISQVGEGIHIIMPGFGQATLAGSGPIFFNSCVSAAQFMGGNCTGTCDEKAQGARPSLAAFSTAEGILIASLQVTIDRSYTFAQGACTEAGCPCGATLTGDASTSELVLTRFNGSVEGAKEVGRFALEGGATSVTLMGSQRENSASLAWVNETSTSVSYVTLNLGALP